MSLEQASTFDFHVLDAPCLPSLQSKAISERLQKWSVSILPFGLSRSAS